MADKTAPTRSPKSSGRERDVHSSEQDQTTTSELAAYPLNHDRGYTPFPRDATRFGPLIKDGNAFRAYAVLHSRSVSVPQWVRGSHGDVYLERGQCICGVRELGEELDLAKNTAHRVLKKLEKFALITRKAGQRGSVITLVNFGVYGDEWKARGKSGTAVATAPDRAVATPVATAVATAPDPLVTEERKNDYSTASAEVGTGDDSFSQDVTVSRSASGLDPSLKTVTTQEPATRNGQLELASGDSKAKPVKAPKTKAKTKAKPSSEHTEFVSAFTELFKKANQGFSPTWNAKNGAMVKRLLSSHGLADCLSRAENMFTAPPAWPPPPHDLSTFSQHYDKFAIPHKTNTSGHHKVTGAEAYGKGKIEI